MELSNAAELSTEIILYRIPHKGKEFWRYDVILEPKRECDDAVILEFKVFNSRREKELADTVKAALQKIGEKNYEAVLTAKGIEKERIQKYGFALCGNEVLVGS